MAKPDFGKTGPMHWTQRVQNKIRLISRPGLALDALPTEASWDNFPGFSLGRAHLLAPAAIPAELKDLCWAWTGPLVSNRYAHVSVPYEARQVQLHRYLFECLFGPAGRLAQDHCATPGCVNPFHWKDTGHRLRPGAPLKAFKPGAPIKITDAAADEQDTKELVQLIDEFVGNAQSPTVDQLRAHYVPTFPEEMFLEALKRSDPFIRRKLNL